MLSITDMQYLVALAEDNHFGRAAARCNVSQPALSAAISKLESQLGFLLFERLNRGVMITPEGKALAYFKVDDARFKTYDASAAESKYSRFTLLGLGYGVTSWFSATP